MFGSWFGKPHARKPSEEAPLQGQLDSASPSTHTVEGLPPHIGHNEDGPADYFNPHDAVLTELEGHHAEPRSRSHTVASQGETAESYASASPDPPLTRRPTHGRKRPPSARTSVAESMYDPFTGHLMGTLHPFHASTSGAGSGGTEDGESVIEAGPEGDDANMAFDAARDELWDHLERIRALQSEIATLHVQMEGAALGERKPGAGRRVSSTVGGMGRPGTSVSGSGADWEEEEDEEAEARRERDLEFDRLPGRFGRRKEAVDGVMGKLDELAKALTSFHALQTPVNTFPRSRSNTEDTGPPFASGAQGPSGMSYSSGLHGYPHTTLPGRFSAPGPRFDSSPAMAPRMLLSPDVLGSPPRSYAQLTGSPARQPAPLIVEEPQGFET